MEIKFIGVVSKGCGLFANQNPLPTTVAELAHLEDWPNSFEQGTFNIKVNKENIPIIANFDFMSQGVRCLDLHPEFPPAAYLNYSVIPNNTITPEKKGENAGDLQFWKTTLHVPDKSISHNCYMLRRVRSGYAFDIELVSNLHLRNDFGLENGGQVILTVFGENPNNQLNLTA